MDFSTFNLSTLLMLIVAFSIVYIGIKFFTGLIYKIICFSIGSVLLIWILGKFGISIPVITDLINYFFNMLSIVFENLQHIFDKFQ